MEKVEKIEFECNLINKKTKREKKISQEKRKNMGFIPKESKKKINDKNINPKTNMPIKKTCNNSDNIIQKIIRIIIRQLNKLLNNNIIDKERYYNLSKLLAINNNENKSNNKNKDEIFKQLEDNNEKNSITNVTVESYEKIKKMTINEIFENLNTSKMYRNYFPFHNLILINLIKKDENEYKIKKILKMTFSELLLYYQYFPLPNNNKDNEKYIEVIALKNLIEELKLNFEGINTLFDSIINLQNKKDNDNKKKYDEEYINKYIDLALGYHQFFSYRKINRKNKPKMKILINEDYINENLSTF